MRIAVLDDLVDDPDLQVAVFRFAVDLPPPAKGFIERGQRLRQALFGLPYGDQGLLVRRELFQSAGGVPPYSSFRDGPAVPRPQPRCPENLHPSPPPPHI